MKADDKSSLLHEILGVISSVCEGGPKSLHEPVFNGNEKAYLIECIDSTYVSSVGKYVDQLSQS